MIRANEKQVPDAKNGRPRDRIDAELGPDDLASLSDTPQDEAKHPLLEDCLSA